MARQKRKKISKASVKKAMRVFRFVKPFRFVFSVGMLVLIVSSLIMMAFPKVLGNLIDSVNSANEDAVNNITLTLIGIFLIIAIKSFEYSQNMLSLLAGTQHFQNPHCISILFGCWNRELGIFPDAMGFLPLIS